MRIAILNENSQDLSDSISYLLQVVRTEIEQSLPSETNSWDATAISKFSSLFAGTHTTCDKIKKQASLLLSRSEQQYSRYTTTPGIQESESVKKFTILAAMFLPLSLAIGMLRMQFSFQSSCVSAL